MLLLTASSHVVRLVTSAAVSTITCHASFVDLVSGTVTPQPPANLHITTATTVTLVSGPSSGQRNVKAIYITNNNATTPCQVTVQHYDGTTSTDLMGVTLLPGENLVFDEEGKWSHHDSQGADYGFNPQVSAPYGFAGCKAESIPRTLAGVTIAGASGTMFMQAIWLPAGMIINNLYSMSGTTGGANQTARWMALYDQSRSLLRQSADQGGAALAANTLFTAPITSYTTTYSGLYYIAMLTTASPANSWIGVTAAGNSAIRNLPPVLTGTSNSGLSGVAPVSANAITGTTNSYWVAVS